MRRLLCQSQPSLLVVGPTASTIAAATELGTEFIVRHTDGSDGSGDLPVERLAQNRVSGP